MSFMILCRANDLIIKLLQKIPRDRISAEEALLHPWVTGRASHDLDLTRAMSRLQTMRSYRNYSMDRGLTTDIDAVWRALRF